MADAQITISLGDVIGFAGFIIQMAIPLGAVMMGFSALRVRVTAVEDRIKEMGDFGALGQRIVTLEDQHREYAILTKAVAKLEAEIESVGREIKNIREDFKSTRDDFRRVLDELTQARRRA